MSGYRVSGIGFRVQTNLSSPEPRNPNPDTRPLSKTFDHPVRVLVAALQRVLADDLAAVAVAGGGQRLVVEAAPGQGHHLDAAGVEQENGAGGHPAAQDDP